MYLVSFSSRNSPESLKIILMATHLQTNSKSHKYCRSRWLRIIVKNSILQYRSFLGLYQLTFLYIQKNFHGLKNWQNLLIYVGHDKKGLVQNLPKICSFYFNIVISKFVNMIIHNNSISKNLIYSGHNSFLHH